MGKFPGDGGEEFLVGQGVVGIVDQTDNAVIRISDEFHATGDLTSGKTGGDCRGCNPHQLGAGNGDQCVFDIEKAWEADGTRL